MKERTETVVIPLKGIPVLPLRNSMLFPGQVIPVIVGRPLSVSAVDESLAKDKFIFVVAQKSDVGAGEPKPSDLNQSGVLARIENKVGGDDGKGFQLLLAGVVRFSVDEWFERDGYLSIHGHPVEDILDLEPAESEALMAAVRSMAGEISQMVPPPIAQFIQGLQGIKDPVLMANMLCQNLELSLEIKQKLLETRSLKERFTSAIQYLGQVSEELRVRREVSQKVSTKLGKQQREALLREQIKAMQDELGEGRSSLIGDYQEKIRAAGMPAEAEKMALDELQRLEATNPASPETQVIRNHLDLMVSLPWSKAAEGEIDLVRARALLERDHFGLEKIKRRIIEHLAVMKLNPKKKGSILVFRGPPGVGKTSLAKSIAEALGRPYVRVSLGGVRDDAEIRGHRRTYVGALPGRIIDGIKRAGTKNPVFVLDEIDKLGRGFTGDPASALLEVLDPEQNANFQDHYLDLPFDLSQVFFIATANSLDSIPGPLLDRMEVIEVNGYTLSEKLDIAKRHLVPKQIEEHGLKREQMEIPDDVLAEVIAHYTREAGVRELQRLVAALIRSSAERIVSDRLHGPVTLSLEDVDRALGARKFLSETAEMAPQIGVVAGLAWTPIGGDILFVEARAMPGKGQLIVTGQLGDVMKESAQIAWSIVRSRLQSESPEFKPDQVDVHVHVPAGAIPKDGPSAGVTMTLALASMWLNREIDPKLGMTGEVTLRGAVMPVGGIKEKIIAAHRAGLKKILLPRLNERDLRDVPSSILSDLKVVLMDSVSDLFREGLILHSKVGTNPGRFDSISGLA